MKKLRLKMAAAVLVVSFALTGCGTKLYELTEQEQQLVVDYSAYALAKFNIYQKDGMTDAVLDESSKKSIEKKTPATTESSETSQNNDTASDTSQSQTQTDSEDAAVETTPSISLASAIGHDELTVTFEGTTKSSNYKENSAYSLDAGSGFEYVIAYFKISNNTQQAVSLDLFDTDVSYSAKMDDGKTYKAASTFLTYSLSTYQGDVQSQGTVDVVLLFKVPSDTTADSFSMYVDKNQTKYLVEL